MRCGWLGAVVTLLHRAISCPKSTIPRDRLMSDRLFLRSMACLVHALTPYITCMQEFVQATKENSGLDMDKLGEQAGNKSPQALGEIETPKGDVSGEIMLYLCLRVACVSDPATISVPPSAVQISSGSALPFVWPLSRPVGRTFMMSHREKLSNRLPSQASNLLRRNHVILWTPPGAHQLQGSYVWNAGCSWRRAWNQAACLYPGKIGSF